MVSLNEVFCSNEVADIDMIMRKYDIAEGSSTELDLEFFK